MNIDKAIGIKKRRETKGCLFEYQREEPIMCFILRTGSAIRIFHRIIASRYGTLAGPDRTMH